MAEELGPHGGNEAAAAAYRAAGMEPPWERVYRNGEDVTDSPELWPWPWSHYREGQQRPARK